MLFILTQHLSEVALFCSFCVKVANSGPRACRVYLLEGQQELPVLGLYWSRGKGVLPSVLHIREPRSSGTAWLSAGSFCIPVSVGELMS